MLKQYNYIYLVDNINTEQFICMGQIQTISNENPYIGISLDTNFITYFKENALTQYITFFNINKEYNKFSTYITTVIQNYSVDTKKTPVIKYNTDKTISLYDEKFKLINKYFTYTANVFKITPYHPDQIQCEIKNESQPVILLDKFDHTYYNHESKKLHGILKFGDKYIYYKGNGNGATYVGILI